MAKKIVLQVKKPGQTKRKSGKKKQKQGKTSAAPKVRMGPVSSMSSAPIAIGNSVRGVVNKVIPTKNGIRVVGRDFMFLPTGSGSVTTWVAVGGTPLTPAAFADSVVANHTRNYAKFKFNAIVAHYITASPTSATGDVVFYYSSNREAVFLNLTSSNLLGVIMSNPSTVLGPQWVNHSAVLHITGDWKSTDYGMYPDPSDFADGELFLLSKTTTTSSPGYVIFDYDIDFAELQIQPRMLTFPIPRIQYWQMNLGLVGVPVTADTTTTLDEPLKIRGNNIAGSSSSFPTNIAAGDIYKVVFDMTNSNAAGWTSCTATTLFKLQDAGQNVAINLTDGFTCYAVYANTGLIFYQNVSAAYAATEASSFIYGVTASITMQIQVSISLVGTLNTSSNVPNF